MTRVIAGVAGGRRLVVPRGRETRPTGDRTREGLFGTVESILGSLEGVRALDLYAGSGAVGLEALSRGAGQAVLVESAPAAIRAVRANIAALGLEGALLVAGRVEKVLARGPAALAGYARAPASRPGAAPDSNGFPEPASPEPASPEPASLGPASPLAAAGPPGSGVTSGAQSTSASVESLGGFGFVFADPPYGMHNVEITAMLTALRARGWLADGALVVVERGTRGAPVAWPAGYVADRARRYGDATLWYGHAAGV